MQALRISWCFFAALIYEVVVVLPLAALGLFVVPLAICTGDYVPSRITGKSIFTAPSWLWLWGNDEDGYDPLWYRVEHPTWGWFRRMFVWAAIRNSVGNLRFIRWMNPPPIPVRVHSLRGKNWWLAWQGILHRFEYDGSRCWVGIGWKYKPDGVHAPWQKFGVGFGMRVKWKKSE